MILKLIVLIYLYPFLFNCFGNIFFFNSLHYSFFCFISPPLILLSIASHIVIALPNVESAIVVLFKRATKKRSKELLPKIRSERLRAITLQMNNREKYDIGEINNTKFCFLGVSIFSG